LIRQFGRQPLHPSLDRVQPKGIAPIDIFASIWPYLDLQFVALGR
jgi:hypothetical protein